MQGSNLRLLAWEARCHCHKIGLNTRFDNLLYHLTLPFLAGSTSLRGNQPPKTFTRSTSFNRSSSALWFSKICCMTVLGALSGLATATGSGSAVLRDLLTVVFSFQLPVLAGLLPSASFFFGTVQRLPANLKHREPGSSPLLPRPAWATTPKSLGRCCRPQFDPNRGARSSRSDCSPIITMLYAQPENKRPGSKRSAFRLPTAAPGGY